MERLRKNIFPKSPTGITGLDEISFGGLPTGRPTLICGSAGCGKTMFGVQFLVKGITEYNEPGVFISFEESKKDLTTNVRSLGFDLDELTAQNKFKIDHVRVDRSEIEETGEYDLEALMIRIGYSIDSIGAKRVVLDTLETLFSAITNEALLRSEIRRLFQFLKDKGVTAIITAEKGDGTLTRHGLEEYVSDCVILLDFRVIDQIATRRLRIIKYRGSTHGTNEYPFLIDDTGIYVIPITSLKLDYGTSEDIVSSGLPELDRLFGSGGYFRGSSIFVTGTAGAAKTALAAHFAKSSSVRNEKALYFSFEESPDQLVRNMKSIGLDLSKAVASGKLSIHASRPSLQGLEMHLMTLHKLIEEYRPQTVIIDPISSLITIGSSSEVRAMLVRLIDFLKVKGINALFTALTHKQPDDSWNETVDTVSSLTDTWISLCNKDRQGQRVRSLLVVKSRGMSHHNSLVDFVITSNGIKLLLPENTTN